MKLTEGPIGGSAQLPFYRLPRVVAGLAGPRLETFARLAEEFPGGCCLAMPRRRIWVLSSPAARKRVLVENAANYVKGIGQSEARRLIGAGMLTADGEEWSAQRRSAAPLLRSRAVAQMTTPISREAERSVARVGGSDSWALLEVSELLSDYTLRCLAGTLGFPAPNPARVTQAFEVVQDQAMFDTVTLGLLPRWVRPGARRRLEAAVEVLNDEAEAIRSAVAEASGHQPLPPWASRAGVVSLLLAGYETTSTTLAWCLDHLASRPKLQQVLHNEVVAADPLAHSLDLPWCRALFNETLRLRPPVWLLSRRAITADVVDGHRISTGDDIAFGVAPVGSSSFDPNPENTAPSASFGTGPRACPGGHLAQVEGIAWLAVAVRELEFAPPLGRPAQTKARLSQSPANGATVWVRRRDDAVDERPAQEKEPACPIFSTVV